VYKPSLFFAKVFLWYFPKHLSEARGFAAESTINYQVGKMMGFPKTIRSILFTPKKYPTGFP